MRVFLALPHGTTMIDNKRVHGYLDRMPPAYITYKGFRANQNNLLELPHDASSLKARTNKDWELGFRFTFAELNTFDIDTLRRIAGYLGIPITFTYQKLINQIKEKLGDY